DPPHHARSPAAAGHPETIVPAKAPILTWPPAVSAGLSPPRRPRARPEQPALPAVADVEGVVHPGAWRPVLGRHLPGEEPEEPPRVDDLLHHDQLAPGSRAPRRA